VQHQRPPAAHPRQRPLLLRRRQRSRRRRRHRPCLAAAAAAAKTSPSSSSVASSKKGGAIVNRACAPCAADFYSTIARAVGVSRCTACAAGTSTNGATGSATCFVAAGAFLNAATKKVEPCPVDSHCPGGDVATAAASQRIPCPNGASTRGQAGGASLAACFAEAGSVYDGASVGPCPRGSWCAGGSLAGAGKAATACPPGTTTASTGATARAQCTVQPGYYFAAGAAAQCPADSYCVGGSIEGSGSQTQACPTNSFRAPGAARLGQCVIPAGKTYVGGAVVDCPRNFYCVSGAIEAAGSAPVAAPAGTTSAVGTRSLQDCIVDAGRTWTGSATATCPANFYCPAGPISGSGSTPTAVPANTRSDPGASSLGQVRVLAGYYWDAASAAAATCPANFYCPEGAISGSGSTPTAVPANTRSDPGASSLGQVRVLDGYYWDAASAAAAPCPRLAFCAEAPISGLGSSPQTCPAGTVGGPGITRAADCVAPTPAVHASYYAIPSGTTALPDFAALTPYAQRFVATVYYPVTLGLVADSGRSDNVAAVFTGTLDIPTAGSWTFFLASDDGSKMYLSALPDPAALLINNDGLHGTTEVRGAATLAKGAKQVRIEFFEAGSAASIMLLWEGPGVSRQPVPATAWIYDPHSG